MSVSKRFLPDIVHMGVIGVGYQQRRTGIALVCVSWDRNREIDEIDTLELTWAGLLKIKELLFC